LHAEDQRCRRQQQPEETRQPQRRDRERGQPFDRETEQRRDIPTAAAVRARGRLIVDADLAKADPGGETLEETDIIADQLMLDEIDVRLNDLQ